MHLTLTSSVLIMSVWTLKDHWRISPEQLVQLCGGKLFVLSWKTDFHLFSKHLFLWGLQGAGVYPSTHLAEGRETPWTGQRSIEGRTHTHTLIVTHTFRTTGDLVSCSLDLHDTKRARKLHREGALAGRLEIKPRTLLLWDDSTNHWANRATQKLNLKADIQYSSLIWYFCHKCSASWTSLIITAFNRDNVLCASE